MIQVRRILCPTDFSTFSRRAFAQAVTIARWYESSITLLHVAAREPVTAYAPGGAALPSAAVTPQDREALLSAMRHFAASAATHAVRVDFALVEGNAIAEILHHATSASSDLIVIGTHGRSGFERLVLGSVAEKVLRKASSPVLSVPPFAHDVEPLPPVPFSHVLCAIDFSPCSLHGLAYAASLAARAHARLTVVHVIEGAEAPPDMHETMRAMPGSLADYSAMVEADRRARLQDVMADIQGPWASDSILTSGKPYREILRIAAAQPADLIVAGVHGHGAADLLFFGSTAQHLVRQASCPVLTVRQE